jgi:regulator of replication initiation timing
MGAGEVITGAVTAVVTFAGTLLYLPKVRAEARKTNAQAGQIEWGTLRDEIDRLRLRIETQDQRIAELEKLDGERIDREVELVKENRRLRYEVSSLRRRVGQLEEIITTRTTPEDMRAQLDKLKDIE